MGGPSVEARVPEAGSKGVRVEKATGPAAFGKLVYCPPQYHHYTYRHGCKIVFDGPAVRITAKDICQMVLSALKARL